MPSVLLGGNENPPVISEGTGQFRPQQISDSEIRFELSYDGLVDVQEAHLRIANPGNNGGIVAFLCSNLGNVPVGATVRECPPSGEVAGEIIATDVLTVTADTTTIIAAGDLPGLVQLIRQGSIYANVHTLAHPG